MLSRVVFHVKHQKKTTKKKEIHHFTKKNIESLIHLDYK